MPVRILRIAGRLPTSLLAVSLVLPAVPALAQQNADKPPAADQQQSAANKDAAKVQRFLNAQRTLNGAAGNPECFDLGTKALFRLSQDDIDTAFRHLDLYDRFGCPGGHVQAAFRCLTRFFAQIDDKVPNSLNNHIQTCWINPNAQPQAAAAPASQPTTAGSAAPAPSASPQPAPSPQPAVK